MANAYDILASLGLDASSFSGTLQSVQKDAKSQATGITSAFKQLGKDLATPFQQGRDAARASFDQMKQAAAQLVLDGKKGSKEWEVHSRLLKEAGAEALKFDKALEEVERDLLGAEKAGKGLKDGLDGIASSGKLMTGAINFAAVQTGVQAAADSITTLSNGFTDLDTATQQIKTLGAEAAELAEPLRNAALDMSKDMPFMADALTTSMFDALASGIDGSVEEISGFTNTVAKLAVGGGADISEATALMTGQLNAYGLSATDAMSMSDTLFNVVNYGVTSIKDLSSTLSNVVPTAAAAGISMNNVGASLALMTQKGVPTAQSTTKLNQLLIELQKPAKDLEPILAAAGISLESLKQDDLPTSLEKVKKAIDATGGSAIQFFSSSEAAAAFDTLTGDVDQFRQVFEDVSTTTGSAENAYAQMADSVAVKTDTMMARVQAFVTQGMEKLGPSFVAAGRFSAEIAPTATALGGISTAAVNAGKGISAMSSNIAAAGGLSAVFTGMGARIKAMGVAMLGMVKSIGFMKLGLLGVVGGIAAVMFMSEEGKAAMQEIGASLSEAFAPLAKQLAPLITMIVSTVQPMIQAIANLMSSVFINLIDSVVSSLQVVIGIFGEIVGVITPLFEQIIGVLEPILKVVTELIYGAFTALAEPINDFASAFSNIFLELADSMKPVIQSLTQTLVPIFQHLGAVIGQVFSTLGTTIAVLVQSIVPIVQQLAATLLPIVQQLAGTIGSLFTMLASMLGELLTTLAPIIGQLVATLGGVITQLLTSLMPVIQQIVGVLAGTLGTVLKTVVGVIGDIFKVLAPVLQQVVSQIGPIIQMLAETLGGALGQILTVVGQLVGQLLGALAPVITTIGQLIGTLAQTLGEVLGTVLNALMPVIQQLAGVFTQIVGVVGNVVSTLLNGLQPVFKAITDVLSTLLPVLAQIVGTLLNALMPVVKVVADVFGQLLGILGGLIEKIVGALAPVLQVLAELLGSVLGALGGVVSQLAEALAPVLTQLGEAVGLLLGTLGELIGQLLEALMPVVEMVVDGVAMLVEWLGDKLQKGITALMPIITKVVELLAKGLADTIVFLVGLLTDLVQAITPVVKVIGEWLIGAISDAIEWIGGAFSDAFNWASGAINDVGDAIGSFINWIKNAGKNILEFVKNIPILGDVVKGIGKATDFIKNKVGDGIKSVGRFFGFGKSKAEEMAEAAKKTGKQAGGAFNEMGNIGSRAAGRVQGSFISAMQNTMVSIEQAVNKMRELEKAALQAASAALAAFGVNLDPNNPVPVPVPVPRPGGGGGGGGGGTGEGGGGAGGGGSEKEAVDQYRIDLDLQEEVKETWIRDAKKRIKDEKALALELQMIDRRNADARLRIAQDHAGKKHAEALKDLNNFETDSIDAYASVAKAYGDLLAARNEIARKEGEEFLDRLNEFELLAATLRAELVSESDVLKQFADGVDSLRSSLITTGAGGHAELKGILDALPKETLVDVEFKASLDALEKSDDDLKAALDKLPREVLLDVRLASSREKLQKGLADIDKEYQTRFAKIEQDREDDIISEEEKAEQLVLLTAATARKRANEYEAFYGDLEKMRAEDAKKEAEALNDQFSLRKTILDATRALIAAFFTFKDEARQEDLKKELEALDAEAEALSVSLAKRETSFKDFDARIGEISDRRAELNGELESGKVDLGQRAHQALIIGARSFADSQNQVLNQSADDYAQAQEARDKDIELSRLENIKSGMDAEAALQTAQAEAEEKHGAAINATRSKMWAQTIATAAANFAKLREDGGNLMADLGIAAIDALIPVVSGALSTALIQAFAFLGPIGGPIAAGAITALAAGSLSALRALIVDLESNKAAKGVVNIKGPGTDTSDNLHFMLSPGESVVTAKATRAKGNSKLLDWMNRTGRSWKDLLRFELPDLSNWRPPRPALSDAFVTPAGSVEGLQEAVVAIQDMQEGLSQRLDGVQLELAWSRREDTKYRQVMLEKFEEDTGSVDLRSLMTGL